MQHVTSFTPTIFNEFRFQVSNFVNESTNISNQPRSVYTGFATFGANPSNPQDIVMYSPNAGILWPGALIQGATHRGQQAG